MSPARRRAETFDALVESPRSDRGAVDARLEPLLRTVDALRAVEVPTPRPEFVTELREELMAAADELLTEAPRELALPGPAAPAVRRRHRRLAIAAGAVTIVGATTSVSMAAQTALPGDALYPIKRVIEGAELALPSTQTATEEQLALASARLDEVVALTGRNTPAADAQVPGALDDFSEQARTAADSALASGSTTDLTRARSFTASSMVTLQGLEDSVPDEASDELGAAARTLARIDRELAEACPTCPGAAVSLPLEFMANAADRVRPGLPPGESRTVTVIPGNEFTSTQSQPSGQADSPVGDATTSNSVQVTTDGTGDTTTSLGDGVKSTTDGLGHTVNQTTDGVGDAVGDGTADGPLAPAGDAVDNTTDSLGDTVDGTTTTLGDAATGTTPALP